MRSGWRTRYTPLVSDDDRALLESMYRRVIDALAPAPVVHAALGALQPPLRGETALHLLAIGKAAEGMTRAALGWCGDHGAAVHGGVCVTHHQVRGALAPLVHAIGDHPVAGESSRQAADRIGAYITDAIAPGDRVLVLLSGGASALIGAPRDGITTPEYAQITDALLGAGLDIGDINRIRRRLSRWGGGRLGEALTARDATVDVLVISDVPGNALEAIGSGPCVPDTATHASLQTIAERATLPAVVRQRLTSVLDAATALPAPASDRIPHHVISSSAHVGVAVARAAAATGLPAVLFPDALSGEVHACGARVAQTLIDMQRTATPEKSVVCWTGEPSVSLAGATAPAGGRMQALALAAAKVLSEAGDAARGITLLAAGTDGRDGPTDAAGAVITGDTWHAICESNSVEPSPDRALRDRQSHHALQRVNALIPAFVTGTNVNDVVIALRTPQA